MAVEDVPGRILKVLIIIPSGWDVTRPEAIMGNIGKNNKDDRDEVLGSLMTAVTPA
jgi:hypothetical protein